MGSAESHSSESNSESLPQHEAPLDQQSLIASAAEIVARQRLAEQLEETASSGNFSNSEPSSSRNSETTRRPRTSTQLTANTQTAARRSHFSTIGELLEDLLENNEVCFMLCVRSIYSLSVSFVTFHVFLIFLSS